MTKMTKNKKIDHFKFTNFFSSYHKSILVFFNFKVIWVIFGSFLVFGLKNQQCAKNGNKLSSGSDKPQFWLGFIIMIFDTIQKFINC